MHDGKWERVSAWGGVAAVICFVVSTAISGKTNPGKVAQFNPAEVARAYTKSHNGIRGRGLRLRPGGLFLLWWFATLWGMMRRRKAARRG